MTWKFCQHFGEFLCGMREGVATPDYMCMYMVGSIARSTKSNHHAGKTAISKCFHDFKLIKLQLCLFRFSTH